MLRDHAVSAPLLAAIFVPLWSLTACGGSQPVVQEPEGFQPATDSQIEDRHRAVQIEGTLGTIPARKIDARLQQRLTKLSRCFVLGMEDVEQVGGNIELSFRVGTTGAVEWVFVRSSSIGHRGTERCILEQAASVRFPEPRGGSAAEFTWGFGMDAAEDIRPPVAWSAARVADVVAAAGGFAACGSSRHTVTVYVAPGGAVLAAGVASDARDGAAAADCIAEAARGLRMPDPGSYPAKVSFELP